MFAVYETASSTELTGWLKKKGGIGWKHRYFQLKGSKLKYTHNAASSESKAIPLAGVSVMRSSRPLSIALVGANGKCILTIACGDKQEHATWLEALQGATRTPKSDAVAKEEGVGPEDYAKIRDIGKGSFGKVVKVQEKATGQVYAMKVMQKDVVMQKQLVKLVMTETAVLRQLDHPFVIKMHASFQTADRLFFLFDFHSGGSLAQHVERRGALSEASARFYAAEITLALLYLHGRGIMHRDLKLGNVLLDCKGHVVVADFGTAKQQPTASSFCGTPVCMAPEVINRQPYTQAVDWWTLGVMLYQMLNGNDPFMARSREALFQRILTEPVRYSNQRLSTEAIKLMEGLLQKDPHARLTGADLLTHPFFHGIDWRALEAKLVTPPWMPDRDYAGSAPNSSILDSGILEKLTRRGSGRKPAAQATGGPFEGFAYAEPACGGRGVSGVPVNRHWQGW